MKPGYLAIALLTLAAGDAWPIGAHETVLHSFEPGMGRPEFPWAPLAPGPDGNLYGTTVVGGLGGAGNGTVYRVTPDGTTTTVYSFAVVDPSIDGKLPDAGLLLGSDGNFYGTTTGGGGAFFDGGTLFRISPQGALVVLHAFGETSVDGTSPRAGLVEGKDGMLYGTTALGGENGVGSVFKVSSSTGAYEQIYSFGPAFPIGDGYFPIGGLVEGTDGSFYGTTGSGGTWNGGTIYRITPDGNESVIYNFGGCPGDGDNPYASLIKGADGAFYGTTRDGGEHNKGTIFRVTPAGELTVIYSFGTLPSDGEDPYEAALTQAADGTLYGTTTCGGENIDPADPHCEHLQQDPKPKGGTAYMLAPDGTYTKLHDFGGVGDGSLPTDGLTPFGDDTLFGVTSVGGANDAGTVFKLTLDGALNASSVKAVPKSCPVSLGSGGRSGGSVSTFSLLVLALAGFLRRSQAKATPSCRLNSGTGSA